MRNPLLVCAVATLSLAGCTTALPANMPLASADPLTFCRSLIAAIATGEKDLAETLLLTSAANATHESVETVRSFVDATSGSVRLMMGGAPYRHRATLDVSLVASFGSMIERWEGAGGAPTYIGCGAGPGPKGRSAVRISGDTALSTVRQSLERFQRENRPATTAI